MIAACLCVLQACGEPSRTGALPVSADAQTTAAVKRHRITQHPQAPFPYADPAEAGLSEAALAALSDQAADWVAGGQLVGAEILIVRGGRIAWHEVIGLADLETGVALKPDGVFRIRSMTKPMIGTVALRFIERGELSLDDTAAEYLPAFDTDRGRGVTLRQLLQHTAGFEFSSFPRDRASYPSLRASVDDLATVVPENPPGEFLYSDGGTTTLGAILEAVSGESLETLLTRELFEPLGLASTFTHYATDVAWRERMNSTHYWDADLGAFRRYWHPGEAQEMPYFRGSGGIYSTAFDYALFLDAWSKALLGAAPGFLGNGIALTALTQATEIPYGLHWEVVSDETGQPLLFGHGGSDGTQALMVPGEELIVLFLTQSRGSSCAQQFSMLAGASGEFGALSEYTAFGRWRDPAPSLEAVALDAEARSRYTGWYDSAGNDVEVRDDGGRLQLLRSVQFPKTITGDGSTPSTIMPGIACRPALAPPYPAVDLIPLGAHRFALGRMEGAHVTEVYWPGRELRFALRNDAVVGYELEYEPPVIERARKYGSALSLPALKRETLPPAGAGETP